VLASVTTRSVTAGRPYACWKSHPSNSGAMLVLVHDARNRSRRSTFTWVSWFGSVIRSGSGLRSRALAMPDALNPRYRRSPTRQALGADAAVPDQRRIEELAAARSHSPLDDQIKWGHLLVGATPTLLQRFVERGIDLAWLYEDGQLAARVSGIDATNPQLRLDQYAATVDQRRALHIARQIVAGKVTNMRVSLLRAARSQDDAQLAAGHERLRTAHRNALVAANQAELMGCEGAATRDYFAGLARIIGSEWSFTGRQRRPPPDPVNSMLSFGYTLLLNEAVAACVLAGLDPYLGMLHSPHRNRPSLALDHPMTGFTERLAYGSPHRNRPSLALDLIEEFRPVVVDATVIRLIRTGAVRHEHFTFTAEHGCRLDELGRRTFLGGYERRILTLVHHPAEGRRISWRQALNVQARQVAAVLTGRQPEYRPVVWR
jgi:CRISPR-associated protein Cas1